MRKPDISDYLFLEDYLAAGYNYRQGKKEKRVLIAAVCIMFFAVIVAGVYAKMQYGI